MADEQDKEKGLNVHGVTVYFDDDLDQWTWEDEDKITEISTRAVRLFLSELRDTCSLQVFSEEVVLSAVNNLSISRDLESMLVEYAVDEDNRAVDRAMLKRMLLRVLALLPPDDDEGDVG